MTRPADPLRAATAVAFVGVALLAVPAAADAAKVKINTSTVSVGDAGVATIRLTNPNRRAAKGTLSLRAGLASIGSRRFKIRARRRATVRVQLSGNALDTLSRGDAVDAMAFAKARGKGTSRKRVRLTYSGAPSGGGNTGGGNTGGGNTGGGNTGGGNTGGPSTGGGTQQPPAAESIDGRWQGTWETNNADLAFNITGTRLYTGPFDAFYLEASCLYNSQPGSDATAFEPIEATISPNGDFYGSGTYRPSPELTMPWTISGHISGRTLTGTFSSSYQSDFNGDCSGTANFTAIWYGDYTL